jgi:hypothetical protein
MKEDKSARALPEKLEGEVSRCCNGKHAKQRGKHSNEIANVLGVGFGRRSFPIRESRPRAQLRKRGTSLMDDLLV